MIARRTRRCLWLLVAAVVCCAPTVRAQSLFYREESKDGRIFVFAQPAAYQSWLQSNGEMGKSTSRIGFGPNGETVVFDSEDAINLYNYKHDKPGEVFVKKVEPPKPAEPLARVGGTIFAEYVYNQQPVDKDAAGNSIRKNSFEVRRAYINVTGSINDIVSYRITPDVASRQATASASLPPGATVSSNLDGSLTIRLKYAYGQFGFDRWLDTKGMWTRFGQQQTPYVDFMEGIYRYRFEGTIFVDREGYLSSSDLGLSGRWVAPREYGEVHLGVYNGETYSRPEANDQKAYQMRATVRPMPKSTTLRGLRLTGFVDGDRPIHGGLRSRMVGAATFEHKYVNAGFEYLAAKDRANGSAATIESRGFTAWATPRTTFGLEGLLRYDRLDPNRTNNAERERGIVGVAYWFRTLKAPLAAAVLAEWETVRYDPAFAKPEENRFGVKTLFAF